MEEDIKILEEMKQNCLTKREYIDQKAERKALAIENLIKEIKKKDKIIDLMTQQIIFYDERLVINNYQSEYEIKKIFIDKVEKEN